MLQQSGFTVSHAAAALALLEIKEMHAAKGGGGGGGHTNTSTVTAGKSVTPQIVMRSLQPIQPEQEAGGCAAVKQKRVQHVPQKGRRSARADPPRLSSAADTEDREPVTSHRARSQ